MSKMILLNNALSKGIFGKLSLFKLQYFVAFLTILFGINSCKPNNSSPTNTGNYSVKTSFYTDYSNLIEVYDKILGIGSYSTIYLGKDTKADTLLAIKVQPYNEVADINHEILQLKKLNFYLGEKVLNNDKESSHYLIMPYIQGKSIDDIYKSNKTFSKKEILKMLITAAESLQAMHEKNLIHNDVHEGNLIYEAKKNKATWVDYAFTIELPGSQKYKQINIKGNPPLHKAPESNQQRGYATDIYQLGFMFLRMSLILASEDSNYRNELINSRAFSYKEIKKQQIDNSTKLFHKMMEKDWNKRPNLSEIIDELKSQI